MKSFNEWMKLFERKSKLIPGQESFYPRYIVRITKEDKFNYWDGHFPPRFRFQAESIWRTLEEAKNHVEDNIGKILKIPFRPAVDKSIKDHRDRWFEAMITYKIKKGEKEKEVFSVDRELDLEGSEGRMSVSHRYDGTKLVGRPQAIEVPKLPITRQMPPWFGP